MHKSFIFSSLFLLTAGFGCSSGSSDPMMAAMGGTAAGGTATGGMTNSAGGFPVNLGGMPSGGTASGGTPASGGMATGGTSTGGFPVATGGFPVMTGGTGGTMGGSGGMMAAGGTANGGTANGGTANGGTANGGAGNSAAACMHASWMIAATDTCMDSNPSCPNIPATQKALTNAIDGDATTRYTSGKTQAGNESVTVTFPSTVTISGVGLTSMNGDGPKMYDVQYSPDGTTFMEFTPAVTGTGSDLLTITFPAPQAMKAVRVKQTGMVMAPATNWWSIYEFTVTGCM